MTKERDPVAGQMLLEVNVFGYAWMFLSRTKMYPECEMSLGQLDAVLFGRVPLRQGHFNGTRLPFNVYFNYIRYIYILNKSCLNIISSVTHTHVLFTVVLSAKHPSGSRPFAHIQSPLTQTEPAQLEQHGLDPIQTVELESHTLRTQTSAIMTGQLFIDEIHGAVVSALDF